MLHRLVIHPSLSLEQAWNALEGNHHIEVFYGSEEEGQIELYAYLPSSEALSSLEWILACDPYTLPRIDWQAQWAAHGHNFQEGYVHVHFDAFGRAASSLRLQPGAGFGDLSHPTTRLMLRLLSQYLHQQLVIDIGCGSGILTLAAVAMEAPFAYGIDIEVEALEHSRQNAALNHLEQQCLFSTPDNFTWPTTSQSVLMLMNMIQSEQQRAWSALSCLHEQAGEFLTSGIRTEERKTYLTQTQYWGWALQDEQEEEGWLAFYFKKSD